LKNNIDNSLSVLFKKSLYQSYLVVSNSLVDQYHTNQNGYGMSRAAIRGQQVFTGAGKYDACHALPVWVWV
jgi:hypothetical protein